MVKSPIILGIVLAIVLAGCKLTLPKNEASVENEIHYHAGFVVFVDSVKQDYSSNKYMQIEPCLIDEPAQKTTEEIQMDKGHLHNNVGDVVHVHTDGAVWGDFFTNIHASFDQTATFSAYIDGQSVEEIMTKPIKPYESLVLLVGSHDGVLDQFLNEGVTRKQIEEAEAQVENCGT